MLKIVQLNAENLFLFLDDHTPRDWKNLPEKEWQRLSSATVPNKPILKTLWLAETLLDINADIVCLNEVGGEESLNNFAKFFLGGRYRPYIMEGNSDRGIDVGYLVRNDFPFKLELRTHKNRPLNFLYPHERDTNLYLEGLEPERIVKTHYFSRDCAELRVFSEDEPGKPKLVILLVHLKSKLDPDGIDPEGRERRKAECKTLMEIYREIRAEFSPSIPTIVAGDFNGSARKGSTAEEFEEMTKTDLESVIDIAGHDGEVAATQLQFNRGGGINFLQIDFLFVSPELKEHLISEQVGVYRYKSDLRVTLPLPKTIDQRIALPSDHYPVVATFKDFLGKK